MVPILFRYTPITGGRDFTKSYLPGLMTIVNDQKTFRLGNPVQLSQEGCWLTYTEKDIDGTGRISDIVRNSGSIAVSQYGNNVRQVLFDQLALDRLDREPLNIDRIHPPGRAHQAGETGSVAAWTATIIHDRHACTNSKCGNSFI